MLFVSLLYHPSYHSKKISFADSLRVSDIAAVEIKELQNTASTARGVAGVLIGTVAFGGVGMIAGAVLGSQKMESPVTWHFKNGTKALGYCNGPMLKMLEQWIFEEKITLGKPERIEAVHPQVAQAKPGFLGRLIGKFIAFSMLGIVALIVLAVIASLFK